MIDFRSFLTYIWRGIYKHESINTKRNGTRGLTYIAIPLKSVNLWIIFQKIIYFFGLYSKKFAEFKILKAYDIKETAIVTPDNYLDWLI